MTSSRRALVPWRQRFVDAGRATGRIARWQVAFVALGVAALVAKQTDAPADVIRTLVTLFVAVGLAPILVDSAAATIASSPTCLRRRFGHRLVWITPGTIGWIVVQWLLVVDPRRALPPRWVWLELATSLAIVLAAEVVSARTTRATGLSGLAALVCATAAVYAVSRYVALVPVAEHELRFATIGILAMIVCWVASSDPGLRMNRGRCSPRQVVQQEPISEGTCKSATVG